LVVNKLFAVYAPAGGLTLLAQFQNLMALLTTLPNDGVHVGLVTYLAPLRPGSRRYRAWLGAALGLNAAALLAGAAVLASRGLLGWGWGSLAVFLGGIALAYGQGMLGAALLAAGRLRASLALSGMLAVLGTGRGLREPCWAAGRSPACCWLICWGRASPPGPRWRWPRAPGCCGT
jgi:PST family polysaccharide transporter